MLGIFNAESVSRSLKIVTQKDSPEIIHSFVLSDSGKAIDAGGVISVRDVLERYITGVTDMDFSNFLN